MNALEIAMARWPQLARLVERLAPAESEAPGRHAVDPRADDAPPTQTSREGGAIPASQSSRDDDAVATLVAALRDPSAEVASQAAEALARHRSAVATSALTMVVENRDGYFNAMTRASAVRALGTLLPAHEGALLVAAVSDVDALVSLAAIAALAERDDSASASALMTVLENRAGFYLPLTRQAAARAISRLRNYEPDRLRRVMESEFDPAVRETLTSLAN
jgi:HEAT repeat protein